MNWNIEQAKQSNFITIARLRIMDLKITFGSTKNPQNGTHQFLKVKKQRKKSYAFLISQLRLSYNFRRLVNVKTYISYYNIFNGIFPSTKNLIWHCILNNVWGIRHDLLTCWLLSWKANQNCSKCKRNPNICTYVILSVEKLTNLCPVLPIWNFLGKYYKIFPCPFSVYICNWKKYNFNWTC